MHSRETPTGCSMLGIDAPIHILNDFTLSEMGDA